MGLINTIYIKEKTKCTFCGKKLGYTEETIKIVKENRNIDLEVGWDIQSKDMNNRCNKFNFGERVVMEDGGLTFFAKGDTTWLGTGHCDNCKKGFDCDIIIKDGVIVEITNFRDWRRDL